MFTCKHEYIYNTTIKTKTVTLKYFQQYRQEQDICRKKKGQEKEAVRVFFYLHIKFRHAILTNQQYNIRTVKHPTTSF